MHVQGLEGAAGEEAESVASWSTLDCATEAMGSLWLHPEAAGSASVSTPSGTATGGVDLACLLECCLLEKQVQEDLPLCALWLRHQLFQCVYTASAASLLRHGRLIKINPARSR